MEVKVDFGKAVSESWAIEKTNMVLAIVATLAASAVGVLTLCICLGGLMAGLMGVFLRLHDKDAATPQIGDVFGGFKYTLPGFVLTLVGGSGFLLCGVGALVTLPLMFLALIRLADTGNTEGCGIAVLKEVIEQVKKSGWMVCLWMLVAGILVDVGMLLCGIGVLVTAPLGFLTMVAVYRQLFPKGGQPVAA